MIMIPLVHIYWAHVLFSSSILTTALYSRYWFNFAGELLSFREERKVTHKGGTRHAREPGIWAQFCWPVETGSPPTPRVLPPLIVCVFTTIRETFQSTKVGADSANLPEQKETWWPLEAQPNGQIWASWIICHLWTDCTEESFIVGVSGTCLTFSCKGMN